MYICTDRLENNRLIGVLKADKPLFQNTDKFFYYQHDSVARRLKTPIACNK